LIRVPGIDEARIIVKWKCILLSALSVVRSVKCRSSLEEIVLSTVVNVLRSIDSQKQRTGAEENILKEIGETSQQQVLMTSVCRFSPN